MTRLVLFCDVGSVITKVTLMEVEESSSSWRVLGSDWAQTTLEPPNPDVMVGLREALRRLEKETGQTLLDGARLLIPRVNHMGVDFFAGTTSAGGGLNVLVAGLTQEITARSGNKAALGAGAHVASVLSLQDMRGDFATIEKIRKEKVDMILVTGGTDGGNVRDVLSLLEFIAMVNPSPRAGNGAKMPLLYAGNQRAREFIHDVIGDKMEVILAENVRPTVDTESFYSVRKAIQKIFLDHMVTHTPGYKTLALWANHLVKPTPLAVSDGIMLLWKTLFSEEDKNLDSPKSSPKPAHLAGEKESSLTPSSIFRDMVAVDMGASTVDVFSIVDGELSRTVTFNSGVSSHPYDPLPRSVEGSSGPRVEDVSRWLPWDFDEDLVRNWSFNKTLRPATVPESPQDLFLEHAYCREMMRTAFLEHRSSVTGLKGLSASEKLQRPGLNKADNSESLVRLMRVRAVVGTGGPLSRAPRPSQALMVLLDGIQPEGVTDLFLDRGIFLASLGCILDTLNNDQARNFIEDLISSGHILPLGTVIAPVGPRVTPGTEIAKVVVRGSQGTSSYSILAGDLTTVKLNAWSRDGLDSPPVQVEITPARGFNVGSGSGFPATVSVRGGLAGLILDGRGRPLNLPPREDARIEALKRWWLEMGAYDEDMLAKYTAEPKGQLVLGRTS